MTIVSPSTDPALPSSPACGSDEARWQAVIANDRGADGQFVYAVVTTGVFCRPSCASRRPARENVRFFDSAAAAWQAGYRPCRRCRGGAGPDAGDGIETVRRVCAMLESAADAAPPLAELAEAAGLGRHHLHRLFRRTVGVTPRQYWDARRLARLKSALRAGSDVAGAQYAAGYGSSSRLYEKAGPQLGMTPASYGAGGRGAVIAHATAPCLLGLLLVAATGRGVCFVGLGDDAAALRAELAGDFPRAELVEDPAGLGGMLARVVAHLRGQEPHLALPLDVRATGFQRQVWEALRAIPYGETRAYGALAASLGRPGAARAVGRACAGNPVSLLVPCHRAVGSDGALTGYRWGVERKRKLIESERANAGGG